MIEKVTEYNTKGEEILKNLVTGESMIINHVVMNPGQVFPAHLTETDTYIIISNGGLSVELDRQPAHIYNRGKMISFPGGTVSRLSNPLESRNELYVVKAIVKK